MHKTHEQRISELDSELAALRSKVEALGSPQPCWERIAGSFEKDPIYEKAMKLGRQYRQSLSPDAKSGNNR